MSSTFSFSFPRTKILAGFAGLLLLFFANLLLSVEEKKLTVYASGKTYSVSVVDSDKNEYVALSEVLQPLGKLTLRAEGRTLHLRLNATDGEFSEGLKMARIGKTQLLLPAKAIVDQGRMLVPLRTLPRIIKQYLGQDADLHEQGRRLFVGQVGETFTIEIKRPENDLVLSFPSPVSPKITNDGNRVHLTFDRDPVIFGAESLTYNDKAITGISLSEHNGAAEIVVTGPSALMATLQDGGKTISVAGAPAAVIPPVSAPSTAQSAAAPQPAAQSGTTAPPLPAAKANEPSSSQPASAVPFFVMIDPSHGGDESGARFSDKLLEKDITLAVARRLRTELHNRGVAAVLLRDGDTTLSYDQRAVATNAQRAAIYVSIHAGIPGSGVRVYTALLSADAAPDKNKKTGLFIPWERAQQSHVEASRILANAMVGELTAAKINTASASAPLMPLNSINAPAAAIEIAPAGLDGKLDTMTAPKYQQSIATAVAAAIVNARPKLEGHP